MFLRNRRAFRGPQGGSTGAAAPTTDDPNDYGTVAAWYDPPAGSTDGYTLSGSNVTVLKDRSSNLRHATALGTGPTITTVGGEDAFVMLNSTDRRLHWSGTAVDVKAFVYVFRPTTNITNSSTGRYLFGLINDYRGAGVGGITNNFLKEIALLRCNSDTNGDHYRAIEQDSQTLSTSTTYIFGGRWNGARWELYLNSDWDRSNEEVSNGTSISTTRLTIGGRDAGGTAGNANGPDHSFLQAVFFSSSLNDTNWQAYLASLATRFSVTLDSTPLTAAVLSNRTGSTAAETPVEVNPLTGATAGSGSITASTVVETTSPTKGDISINGTTGVVTYTPNAGIEDTTDSYGVKVRDSNGLLSSEGFTTITIGVAAGATTITPWMGTGIGCAHGGIINLTNITLNTTNRTAVYCIQSPIDGTVETVGFELASNQNAEEGEDNEKSAGSGNLTVPIKIVKGKAAVSGDGSVPTRPDFNTVYYDGSVVHDRGAAANGDGGDKRKLHFVELTNPATLIAGEYICVVVYPVSSNPSSNYVSVNNPYLRSGSAYYSTATPASRRFGPYWSPDKAPLLREASPYTSVDADKRYNRTGEAHALGELIYDDGQTWGSGYRQPDRSPSGTPIKIQGSNFKVRHRFRHVGTTFNCRYVWFACYWRNVTGNTTQPTNGLTLTLTNDTDVDSWTDTLDAGDGTDSSQSFVKPWAVGEATSNGTTYVDWVKFDLGEEVEIENGDDYDLTFTTTDAKGYECFAINLMRFHEITAGFAPSETNVWKAQYGQTTGHSFSQRTTTGSNWAAIPIFSTNGTIPVWLEAA